MAFTYTTPGAASRSLVISIAERRLLTQTSNAPQVPGPIEPRCRYGQAWKSAVGAGLPANTEHEAIYGLNGRPTWSFESKGTRPIEVDGQTCAARRLISAMWGRGRPLPGLAYPGRGRSG